METVKGFSPVAFIIVLIIVVLLAIKIIITYADEIDSIGKVDVYYGCKI